MLNGTRCRGCWNTYKRQWRANYKEAHGEPESRRYVQANGEKFAKSRAKRVARNRNIVLQRKWKPCSDCAGTFPPICMNFDHVNGEKEAGIARMVNQGVGVEKLLAELDKCELVCANCHRIRTSKREKPWEEELRKYDRSAWYKEDAAQYYTDSNMWFEFLP